MPDIGATQGDEAPPDTGKRVEALVALLLREGEVDAAGLERARMVARQSAARLDRMLVALGLVSEAGMARAYSRLLDLPLTAERAYPDLLPEAAAALPARFLQEAQAVPLREEEGALAVAFGDPLDVFAPSAIAAATGRAIRREVGEPQHVEQALKRLCAPPEEAAPAAAPLEEDAERLRDQASEEPVIQAVNRVISRAVETQASDIHLDPTPEGLAVRFRHDGVLSEFLTLDASMTLPIVSRLKIMASLDIAERRLPQDGRIRQVVRGKLVDFRASTIPSLHGETVVLRVLDRGSVPLDYDHLGLPDSIVAALRTALETPNGIVLVTGPTGSGKTTTLYTALGSIDHVGRKVVTIEDPIEYQRPGITQIQVKPQIGLTFAHLLRSILRQNPDVIMVGEIRDGETAQIAVQSALTGHLVLSTLHTNSAAAAVTRLRDMGIEDYLLTAVLRGVLAQRLVRRLCPHCRREEEAPAAVIRELGLTPPADGRPLRLWRAVGCPECRKGFRGRLAIAEFLKPDPGISRLIMARADHAEIERAAVEQGMVTMLQAGLDAALAGLTTVEEVVRAVREQG